MKELVSGKHEFVELWHNICDKQEEDEAKWIKRLRANGFKAAHPNDGWVDRENNTLHFAYPQFNDGADVGDMVMLGWPSDSPDKSRAVRLTGIKGGFLKLFTFVDA